VQAGYKGSCQTVRARHDAQPARLLPTCRYVARRAHRRQQRACWQAARPMNDCNPPKEQSRGRAQERRQGAPHPPKACSDGAQRTQHSAGQFGASLSAVQACYVALGRSGAPPESLAMERAQTGGRLRHSRVMAHGACRMLLGPSAAPTHPKRVSACCGQRRVRRMAAARSCPQLTPSPLEPQPQPQAQARRVGWGWGPAEEAPGARGGSGRAQATLLMPRAPPPPRALLLLLLLLLLLPPLPLPPAQAPWLRPPPLPAPGHQSRPAPPRLRPHPPPPPRWLSACRPPAAPLAAPLPGACARHPLLLLLLLSCRCRSLGWCLQGPGPEGQVGRGQGRGVGRRAQGRRAW
jgi:hypothetical protein